jgi:hypothetical protein
LEELEDLVLLLGGEELDWAPLCMSMSASGDDRSQKLIDRIRPKLTKWYDPVVLPGSG